MTRSAMLSTALLSSFHSNVQNLLPKSLLQASTNYLVVICNYSSVSPFDNVLSAESRQRCVQHLAQLERMTVKENVQMSAVVVPLCRHNDEVGLVFTVRSQNVRSHKGQVCFPGGHPHKRDKGLVHTALREMEEEVGIVSRDVDIWGLLPLFPTSSESFVQPVLGSIGQLRLSSLKLGDEVDELFVRSLKSLSDPQNFYYTRFISNFLGPVYLGGEHRIWGITAMITHQALHVLLPGVYTNQVVRAKERIDQELQERQKVESRNEKTNAKSASP